MKFFRGCTALITGSSAGLGLEMARQLSAEAGTLILVARRVERLNSLKQELEKAAPGLRVFVYGLDLSNEAAIDEFVAWLFSNNLRVNFLINNAGLGDHGTFETSDWDKVRAILSVNIVALTKLTRRLMPMLRSFDEAAILNVSSIAGFLPVAEMAVYAATKAYVTSFSEAIRAELRGTGVTVTALCPGPVSTEFDLVARRDGKSSMSAPEFFKVPAEKVVRDALNAVAADRARVAPGWMVALFVVIASITPMVVLRWLSARKPWQGVQRAAEYARGAA